MSDELLINGEALDLGEEGAFLPSFQMSTLLEPDKIVSDYSPQRAVPGNNRNHRILGHAAYEGATAGVPYRSIAGVVLRSDGVEIMPRARAFLKGYQEGSYQLQLVAGNRRFVEALGELTLQDLDFSRFNHTWVLDNIAQRATAGYWRENGWGYEFLDRGRPVDATAANAFDLYPTFSAALLWQQILAQTGFAATSWQSPLLDKLQVPSVQRATLSEEFRAARRLRVGLGPDQEKSGEPSSNRGDVVETIPFDDATRLLGTVPPITPTVPGVYQQVTYSYVPDKTVYVAVQARTTVRFKYSDIRLGQAQARVELHVNGQRVAQGANMPTKSEDPFSVGITTDRLLLRKGDVLTAVLVLSGVGSAPIDKWGYIIFSDQVFNVGGQTVPIDKFEVTVLEELPPGGEVNIASFLPRVKLLDFFKCLCQLGGLSVRCDGYEDLLLLSPATALLGNIPRAWDWTSKRDTSGLLPGQPRNVTYQYGSFGQRNFVRWAPDETNQLGFQGAPRTEAGPNYGDGILAVADASLPATYDLLTLPFAATEPSARLAGLLCIPAYKLRENEDPFAEPAYDTIVPKPRLTLASGRTQSVSLRGGPLPAPLPTNPTEQQQKDYAAALALHNTARQVETPISYFASADEAVSLDLHAYVLPVNWIELRAMLTECRYHRERYRLSPSDLAQLLAEPDRPIWDGQLQGYFRLARVNEYSALRSVEVEMLRLYPALLTAPKPDTATGREFYENEFYTPTEFY